jgi:hypothetical protein
MEASMTIHDFSHLSEHAPIQITTKIELEALKTHRTQRQLPHKKPPLSKDITPLDTLLIQTLNLRQQQTQNKCKTLIQQIPNTPNTINNNKDNLILNQLSSKIHNLITTSTKLHWTAKETGWTDAAREEFCAMRSTISQAYKK